MSEPHDSIAVAAACEHIELVLDPTPLLRAAWPTAEERAAASRWFDPSVAVPFALDESGRRVLAAHRPDRESPGQSHTCPFCDGAVTLRESARLVRDANRGFFTRYKVRPHWVHRHETCLVAPTRRRGSRNVGRSHASESATHKRAKRCIVYEIEAWKKGLIEAPQIEHSCRVPECSESTKIVALDEHIVKAVEEYRLESGYVVDVALLDTDDCVVLGVEIYVTHEVGLEKRAEIGIPWLELDALGYASGRWRVRQSSVPAEPCKSCRTAIDPARRWWAEHGDDPEVTQYIEREKQRRLENLARELTEKEQRQIRAQAMRDYEIRLPAEEQRRRAIETAKTLALMIPPGYTAHRWYCHECRNPMLVFSWLERRTGKEPPVPHPPGLEHRDGSTWSQHCPRCGWEQTIRWRRRDEGAPARDL